MSSVESVTGLPECFVTRSRASCSCAGLRTAKAEGIVFKQRSSPYKAGRPSSGGAHRKHKFIKSADVVLLSNAGNAYLMGVYDSSTGKYTSPFSETLLVDAFKLYSRSRSRAASRI